MDPRLNPRLYKSEPVQRCSFPDCKAACCLYGAWVDTRRIKEIQAHADLIKPHMNADHRDPEYWFDDQEEQDPYLLSGRAGHTQVIEDLDHYGQTTCIFMRSDYKCALQVAAEVNELHPWHFKPFYCILHPLDLDTQGRLTLDEIQLMVAEPGSCLRTAPHKTPLTEIFMLELGYFLGQKAANK